MFYEGASRYRKNLASDHEPDEIDGQMSAYVPMLHLRSRISIGAYDTDEKIRESYGGRDFGGFFDSVEYVRRYEKYFDPFPMMEKLFDEYGAPDDAEERLLKAEIANDAEMASFLRKYVRKVR